jgi:hypothetical protein
VVVATRRFRHAWYCFALLRWLPIAIALSLVFLFSEQCRSEPLTLAAFLYLDRHSMARQTPLLTVLHPIFVHASIVLWTTTTTAVYRSLHLSLGTNCTSEEVIFQINLNHWFFIFYKLLNKKNLGKQNKIPPHPPNDGREIQEDMHADSPHASRFLFLPWRHVLNWNMHNYLF